MDDLDAIVKSEYDDLEQVIGQIEGASEEFKNLTTSTKLIKPNRDLCDELTEIVRAQNKIIHSLNAYSQEL
jgi:hypothetical protein